MSRSPQPSAGFTLVELVVALAVLALTSTLMAQAIRFGLHTWDAIDSKLSRMQAVTTAQQALRGRLSQAYPYQGRVQSPTASTAPIALQGSGNELSFSAPPPLGQPGPLQRYRVYLAPGGRLTVSSRLDGAATAGSEETLLDGVSELAFEYFAPAGQQPAAWLTDWQGRDGLPKLVRVHLHFTRGSDEDWPLLVIQPRLDMPVDCQFDMVSRRCR